MTDEASADGGRPVHEWDASYEGEPAPWDVGRPQAVFIALADRGAIRGRVLDAGCGTGEHALLAAERGMDATGIDISPRAIALAQRKADERGLAARFVAGDALQLRDLDAQFDTVLDCGLFHSFGDEQRVQYVRSLADVVASGGRLFLCCFSDEEPGEWGPRRVRQDELRASFRDGWTIESIGPAELETTIQPQGSRAWLMTATRD
ncbi:MAG TPA: class I SAM-dependent methyltransferase [Jatrophihabitantaceae bacterium]|nr:class I SAM-dependent methyltransferase [Jatrophihabitantaceae bacterium]